MPYPAIATDRHGDLVHGNGAFWAMVAGVDVAASDTTGECSSAALATGRDGATDPEPPVWGWHVIEALQREALRNPNPRLDALVAEPEGLAPDRPLAGNPDFIGFAVPLRLRTAGADLELITTLTYFGTAVDVTLAELRLEAFPPADQATAAALARFDRFH